MVKKIIFHLTKWDPEGVHLGSCESLCNSNFLFRSALAFAASQEATKYICVRVECIFGPLYGIFLGTQKTV